MNINISIPVSKTGSSLIYLELTLITATGLGAHVSSRKSPLFSSDSMIWGSPGMITL